MRERERVKGILAEYKQKHVVFIIALIRGGTTLKMGNIQKPKREARHIVVVINGQGARQSILLPYC